MHEMSIAVEVGRLAADQVDRTLLPRVTAVGVEVGDRAGVVPDALQFCLEAVLSEPPFGAARPVLEPCGGDVLRLAWIEVDEENGGAGASASNPLGGAPLPSEAGPPPGAGSRGGAADDAQPTEREETR